MVLLLRLTTATATTAAYCNATAVQGYVYVEAMMSELVRDTIGRLPRAVGFIGRRKDENGLRIPDAMHPAEVQQILNHMQNCDTVPDVVSEFGIGDMVEILDGSYGGERGALRLVRAEEFVVRLYTFGTQTGEHLY
jgi:transcription antitermination factor NusG